MRSTQKMKKVPTPPPSREAERETAAPRDAGLAAVQSAREALEKKRLELEALRESDRFGEALRRGQALIREFSDTTLHRKGEPPAEGEAARAPERAEQVEKATREAIEGLAAIEERTREQLARRLRLIAAKQRGLDRYLAARARGLGGPRDEPRKG